MAAVLLMISDEADQLALGVSVALNVPFGRGERPVPGKLLHVAKLATDFADGSGRARDESATPRVRRAAI